MDFISLGYYNDFNALKWILFSFDILMICHALMTSTCQVRSYESIDRLVELMGLWKLKLHGFGFREKKNKNKTKTKKTKMKMKLNEWRQLASCYFFPTFSLLLNILNLFVTNQQIINIVLEYKYFVSCWQHNFVNYCLSCDWSCTQNLICCVIVWLPHRPPLFGVRYCDTIRIAGVKKNTDKARFQLVLTGLYLPRRIPVFRYLCGGKPVCGKV